MCRKLKLFNNVGLYSFFFLSVAIILFYVYFYIYINAGLAFYVCRPYLKKDIFTLVNHYTQIDMD